MVSYHSEFRIFCYSNLNAIANTQKQNMPVNICLFYILPKGEVQLY